MRSFFYPYIRLVLRSVIIVGMVGVLTMGCERRECVDCVDTQGNIFTFCDPAETPLENLECGETYKKR